MNKKDVAATVFLITSILTSMCLASWLTFEPEQPQSIDTKIYPNPSPQQPTLPPSSTPTALITPPEITVSSENGTKLSHVTWGTLSPGENVSKPIYLKSTQHFSNITATIQNPQPQTLTGYMNLTITNQPLPQNLLTQYNLTLQISCSIRNVTDFKFNIVLSAS